MSHHASTSEEVYTFGTDQPPIDDEGRQIYEQRRQRLLKLREEQKARRQLTKEEWRERELKRYPPMTDFERRAIMKMEIEEKEAKRMQNLIRSTPI